MGAEKKIYVQFFSGLFPELFDFTKCNFGHIYLSLNAWSHRNILKFYSLFSENSGNIFHTIIIKK